MKIHIDTSPPQKKALGSTTKPSAKQGTNKTTLSAQKKPTGIKQAAALTSSAAPPGQQQAGAPAHTKPLPTKPKKEPTPPADVAAARKRQSQVLKVRQNREVQGKMRGAPRDVDAGAGFWPPLSPFL